MNIEVTAINTDNRPNEVPISRWIVKGNIYHIIQIDLIKSQNIYGCKIAEINNDDLFPYQYFALYRFGLTQEQADQLYAEQNNPVKKELEEELV